MQKQDPLLVLTKELTDKLVSAKRAKEKKDKTLLRKSNELVQRIEEFEETQNLLTDI